MLAESVQASLLSAETVQRKCEDVHRLEDNRVDRSIFFLHVSSTCFSHLEFYVELPRIMGLPRQAAVGLSTSTFQLTFILHSNTFVLA
jgi:hypothetical protein